MSETRVARVTELIAASPKSFEDAVTSGFNGRVKHYGILRACAFSNSVFP